VINKNLYAEQDEIRRLPTEALSQSAQRGGGGMNGILSLMELSRRAQQERAVAQSKVAGRYSGGSVLSELSNEARQYASAPRPQFEPQPQPAQFNSGGQVGGLGSVIYANEGYPKWISYEEEQRLREREAYRRSIVPLPNSPLFADRYVEEEVPPRYLTRSAPSPEEAVIVPEELLAESPIFQGNGSRPGPQLPSDWVSYAEEQRMNQERQPSVVPLPDSPLFRGRAEPESPENIKMGTSRSSNNWRRENLDGDIGIGGGRGPRTGRRRNREFTDEEKSMGFLDRFSDLISSREDSEKINAERSGIFEYGAFDEEGGVPSQVGSIYGENEPALPPGFVTPEEEAAAKAVAKPKANPNTGASVARGKPVPAPEAPAAKEAEKTGPWQVTKDPNTYARGLAMLQAASGIVNGDDRGFIGNSMRGLSEGGEAYQNQMNLARAQEGNEAMQALRELQAEQNNQYQNSRLEESRMDRIQRGNIAERSLEAEMTMAGMTDNTRRDIAEMNLREAELRELTRRIGSVRGNIIDEYKANTSGGYGDEEFFRDKINPRTGEPYTDLNSYLTDIERAFLSQYKSGGI